MFKFGLSGFLLILCLGKLQAQNDSLSKLHPPDDPLQRVLIRTMSDLKKNGVKEIFKFISYHAAIANATVIWKEDDKIKGINYLFRYSKMKIRKKKIEITPNDYLSLDSLFSNNCTFSMLEEANGEKISHDPIFYVEKDIDGITEHIYFWYSNYLGLKNVLCLQAYNKLFQFRNDWYY